MPVSADLRERIYSAADELLEASESGDFPSVEAVRQASRAGMAAVVECMRDWRRSKTRRPTAVSQPLPAELAAIVQDAAGKLWTAAQRLASERLEAERSAFDAERDEMQELSAQQSEAFEAQTAEVERLRSEVSALRSQLEHAQATAQQKLSKASEMAVAAREEAAQVRGELMGLRVAFSELLAAQSPLPERGRLAHPVSEPSGKPEKAKKASSKTKTASKRQPPEEQPLPL